MTPAGYMAKRPQKPKGFSIDHIKEIYSVSGCVNEDFADYIDLWKHNAYWLFDSPEIIRTVARENSISLDAASLFYYEVYEQEYDGKAWMPYEPEWSLPTSVVQPSVKVLEGFDVVTFMARNAPECSPLSCNGLAKEIRTNARCLLNSFDEAYNNLTEGAFIKAEPGPYRIFAVYSTPWPQS